MGAARPLVCIDRDLLVFTTLRSLVTVEGGNRSMNMLPPERHDEGVHAAAFAWYRTTHQREPIFTTTRTHLDMLRLEPGTLRLNFGECHAGLLRGRRAA